jgi:hypothetical protein
MFDPSARLHGDPQLSIVLGLLMVVSLGLSGCHPSPDAVLPDNPALDDSSVVLLLVNNHNYLDVTVYLAHDGQDTRLGMVTGNSSIRLTFPITMLGQAREVRLVGHPVGTRQVVSSEIMVIQPGQYLEWTVETDVRRSSVGVY